MISANPSKFQGENLPVEMVSWNSCADFCNQTSLSLPSEAQWEYACRAGSLTAHSLAMTEEVLAKVAWFDKISGGQTHPVGSKMPNEFGLHDMRGNVWEWCQDYFNKGFYEKPEASKTNPVCTSGSGHRVFRGGSWGSDAWRCRLAGRYALHPSVRGDDMGFRPARTIE